MNNLFSVPFDIKNIPSHDRAFAPIYKFYKAFCEGIGDGGIPVKIAVERENNQFSAFSLKLYGTPEMRQADLIIGERIVKSLLWCNGGFRVYIGGCDYLADFVRQAYSKGGVREFDAVNMANIYEHEFEVLSVDLDKVPEAHSVSKNIGRHLDGCRIGFDAGGSDRKVSAVIDGETVWSEEVVWHPKTNSDPEYHYAGILDAFRSAAAKMPRVDAIGISSAGIFVENRAMLVSLFVKVSPELFEKKVKDIYIRACKELGENIPFAVANDGDVTALAGAMSLDDTSVLGIAMGTSEAGGFVDSKGNITGCLNELAFMPVDLNPDAMEDEWSGDIGCGVKYFSQDGIIKLAGNAGIDLSAYETPAEKLKAVQALMDKDDKTAKEIYESLGTYLGHTLPWYDVLFDIKHVLLLGRVMSGKGGDIIIATANRVLSEEYPEIAKKMRLSLPDEKFRRVGQSIAAASLPEIL